MFLLIDKPKGLTSHDVIDEIRKVTGEKRVGHAGTLDPNATGLLIVGIGRESTKKLGEIAKGTRKTYLAEVFLGEERDTDDIEGRPQKQVRDSRVAKSVRGDKADFNSLPALSKIERVLSGFVGEQMQAPPVYSAIKIKGEPAYKLARKGEDVELKPRRITVYSIRLISFEFPIIKIEVEVSSGTYIRGLARDIGKKLGCGAYLKNLRRTKIDKFTVENSVKLGKLSRENWNDFVLK